MDTLSAILRKAKQWGDIDFTATCIRIRRSAWYGNVQTTKSKSSAAPAHLPQSLAATLRAYREQWTPNPQGFLFVMRNNRPPSSKVVQEQLRHADRRVTVGMYSHLIGEDR